MSSIDRFWKSTLLMFVFQRNSGCDCLRLRHASTDEFNFMENDNRIIQGLESVDLAEVYIKFPVPHEKQNSIVIAFLKACDYYIRDRQAKDDFKTNERLQEEVTSVLTDIIFLFTDEPIDSVRLTSI